MFTFVPYSCWRLKRFLIISFEMSSVIVTIMGKVPVSVTMVRKTCGIFFKKCMTDVLQTLKKLYLDFLRCCFHLVEMLNIQIYTDFYFMHSECLKLYFISGFSSMKTTLCFATFGTTPALCCFTARRVEESRKWFGCLSFMVPVELIDLVQYVKPSTNSFHIWRTLGSNRRLKLRRKQNPNLFAWTTKCNPACVHTSKENCFSVLVHNMVMLKWTTSNM